jgi:hypothetical protein
MSIRGTIGAVSYDIPANDAIPPCARATLQRVDSDDMLVAIARIPDRAEARTAAAKATGLALADLNRRLAGTLPRVLFAGVGPEGAAMVERLRALGFGVLTCDPAAVPGDGDRVVVRRIEFSGVALVAFDARGEAHHCPPLAIELLQRGTRVSTSSEKVTTSERKLDLGRAVLSGGLLPTKKVSQTTVKTTETAEPFLLVQRCDGQPDLIFYERRIDYRALGPDMQPSSHGNIEVLWAKLRTMVIAPAAVDDRVARPGFVSGLPATSVDPVDLALFLVSLARRSGT